MKEVKILWNGKEEVVVLKKLTWGEMNEVLRQAIGKIKIIGAETPTVDFDVVTFREQLLLKSIKSAPFKIDIETIRNLDPEIADKLLAEALELNPFRGIF
jgi:hypothetical protein